MSESMSAYEYPSWVRRITAHFFTPAKSKRVPYNPIHSTIVRAWAQDIAARDFDYWDRVQVVAYNKHLNTCTHYLAPDDFVPALRRNALLECESGDGLDEEHDVCVQKRHCVHWQSYLDESWRWPALGTHVWIDILWPYLSIIDIFGLTLSCKRVLHYIQFLYEHYPLDLAFDLMYASEPLTCAISPASIDASLHCTVTIPYHPRLAFAFFARARRLLLDCNDLPAVQTITLPLTTLPLQHVTLHLTHYTYTHRRWYNLQSLLQVHLLTLHISLNYTEVLVPLAKCLAARAPNLQKLHLSSVDGIKRHEKLCLVLQTQFPQLQHLHSLILQGIGSTLLGCYVRPETAATVDPWNSVRYVSTLKRAVPTFEDVTQIHRAVYVHLNSARAFEPWLQPNTIVHLIDCTFDLHSLNVNTVLHLMYDTTPYLQSLKLFCYRSSVLDVEGSTIARSAPHVIRKLHTPLPLEWDMDAAMQRWPHLRLVYLKAWTPIRAVPFASRLIPWPLLTRINLEDMQIPMVVCKLLEERYARAELQECNLRCTARNYVFPVVHRDT